ncbi:MAG: TlpA family protein disulfide reductase [Proteobacteria bacterium]|nr:TlpA family protein disulfide reductase [Pseudomonadota bacterium]
MVEEKEEGGGTKIIVAVFVVIAVAVVIGIVVYGGKQGFTPTNAGSSSLDFTLPDLEGKQVNFSEYKGKVIFLNFWATWCEPCKEEMPSMQILYDTFKRRDFVVVAVSVDSGKVGVVKEFVDDHKLTFPVLHDRRGKVKESYKTTGVPETFIIDQNGIIAEKVWGTRNWDDPHAIRTILSLLDNGPGTPESYKTRRK